MLSVSLTSNSIWNAFCNIINDAIDQYAPVKQQSQHNTSKQKGVNYPRRIKKAINRKLCLWHKHKDNPNDPIIEASYRDAEMRYRALVSSYQLNIENEGIHSNNIGSFYKFINKRLTRTQGIGTLQRSDGEFVTGNAERANLLNDFFCSVCTVDDGVTPTFNSLVNNGSKLDCIEFNYCTVTRAIKNSKITAQVDQMAYHHCCIKILQHV